MKHIGTAMAQAIRSIPSRPFSVEESARLALVAGRAYEISGLPISERRAAIDACPDDIRAEVRRRVEAAYRCQQENAALDARIDAGIDVWIEIRDSGKSA